MKHTKYENKNKMEDSGEVLKWLQTHIDGIENIPISVGMNWDRTVSEIEIGKKLTTAEKKIITDKFPELKGKEKVNV